MFSLRQQKSCRLCSPEQAPGLPASVSPPALWSSMGWPRHPSVRRPPEVALQGQAWMLKRQASQGGLGPAAPHPCPSHPIRGDISETRSKAPSSQSLQKTAPHPTPTPTFACPCPRRAAHPASHTPQAASAGRTKLCVERGRALLVPVCNDRARESGCRFDKVGPCTKGLRRLTP